MVVNCDESCPVPAIKFCSCFLSLPISFLSSSSSISFEDDLGDDSVPVGGLGGRLDPDPEPELLVLLLPLLNLCFSLIFLVFLFLFGYSFFVWGCRNFEYWIRFSICDARNPMHLMDVGHFWQPHVCDNKCRG